VSTGRINCFDYMIVVAHLHRLFDAYGRSTPWIGVTLQVLGPWSSTARKLGYTIDTSVSRLQPQIDYDATPSSRLSTERTVNNAVSNCQQRYRALLHIQPGSEDVLHICRRNCFKFGALGRDWKPSHHRLTWSESTSTIVPNLM